MNISSIIVQTKLEHINDVLKELEKCDCEYHTHSQKGHIIITIESKDLNDELAKLRDIENIKYVISANMHMSYSEDELDNHMQVLDNSDVVPKNLDDNVSPRDVVYRGDLKGKDLSNFTKVFDEH